MVKVLMTVASESNPTKVYEIRESLRATASAPAGTPYCTCPAWRFSKNRSCKHLRRFEASVPSVQYFNFIQSEAKRIARDAKAAR